MRHTQAPVIPTRQPVRTTTQAPVTVTNPVVDVVQPMQTFAPIVQEEGIIFVFCWLHVE